MDYEIIKPAEDVLNYFYDANGRLERMTEREVSEIIRYEYDANGQLKAEYKGYI